MSDFDEYCRRVGVIVIGLFCTSIAFALWYWSTGLVCR